MDIFKKFPPDFIAKVIDEANVAIIYFECDGNISICNKKLANFLGIEKENVVGRNWLEAIYNKKDNTSTHKQMLKAVVDDSVKYNRPNNFTGLFTDNDKNERLLCWSITPISSNGAKLQGILLIGNDLTENKEREEALRKIDETLKNIFSSIKEYALFVINLDGNITYYGMGSELMFGWKKSEVVFKDVRVLFPIGQIDSVISSMLAQINESGEYEAELQMLQKDGSSFPVTLTINKFLDSQGKLMGYIFIAKDITERKKWEYQLIQSEKLAAIGQLAAGITHDINNPLFVISGRLEMMLLENNLDKGVKKNLGILNEQAARIKKLIDQLLKFSRKTVPKFDFLNINEVIENVLPLLTYHKLSVSNITIIKEFADDLLQIKGDLNQLQEVFVNLFINAYQSMEGGGKLSIRTSNLTANLIEIRIRDTGTGIPEENLKNIFMPFFSTKKDGTGLGLPICYNIIKGHGGTIEIESKSGKGSTFIIKLPSVEDKE